MTEADERAARIDAIKRRNYHEIAPMYEGLNQAHLDRLFLLGEIERLQAEIREQALMLPKAVARVTESVLAELEEWKAIR